MLAFFRRCCQILVPCCMKRQRSPSPSVVAADNERQPLLGAEPAVQVAQQEAVVVSSEGVFVEEERHNESTWNLDLLFSGSYLYESTEAKAGKVYRRQVKVAAAAVKGEKPPPRPRPTHFLAVKIDAPEVVEAVTRAQAEMVERFPAMKSAIIPASKLHVTLSVLHLPTKEHVESVKASLGSFDWSSFSQVPSLRLHGVGHFRDSVIYADFHHGDGKDALEKLAVTAIDCIKAVCPTALIEEREEKEEKDEEEGKSSTKRRKVAKKAREFHPHVTLAKLSGNNFRKANKMIRKIDRKAHSHLSNSAFGEQKWDRLQLLAMQWPKKVKDDGYYFVESEVLFQGKTC